MQRPVLRAPSVNPGRNQLIQGMEVAIADFFLHQPLGFRVEIHCHTFNLTLLYAISVNRITLSKISPSPTNRNATRITADSRIGSIPNHCVVRSYRLISSETRFTAVKAFDGAANIHAPA